MRWILLLALLAWPAVAQTYDPLSRAAGQPTVRQVTAQAGRPVPLQIYLPAGTAPAPVILFSHGLGGSREAAPYLGEHWAARGYVVIFLQHPGSDTSVWEDKPPAQRMEAMRQAASGTNLQLRIRDVKGVLDWLPRSEFAPRLDLTRVGMSGHSFGAVTTQSVAGQWGFATEPRVRAALILSPSSPRIGNPQRAFAGVKIPCLLMTGTKDVAPIGGQDLASRLAVYPALPPGDKYEVVFEGAEHSAFVARGDGTYHRRVLALNTAFWDAYLRGDASARQWLQGPGPRSVLEKSDRWQKK